MSLKFFFINHKFKYNYYSVAYPTFFTFRSSRGFTFMYGKVEVKAKLPLGDWLWPAIWLLPKRSKYNNDIYNCLHKVLYFTLFYLGTGSGRPAVRLTSWRAGATWTTPITGSTSGWNSLGPLCSMAAVIR